MGTTYTANFCALAHLKDGAPVRVRAVRPDDKALLAQAFEQLSETSRYRRFLHYKVSLSTSELKFLTELDGVDHYALGVVSDDEAQVPMGVARLVRGHDKDREVAEVAVTVMDAHQGRGVGTLMMRHLIVAARERGIERLRFTLLYENKAMMALVRSTLGPTTTIETDGPVMTIEAPVPPAKRAHLLPRWLIGTRRYTAPRSGRPAPG